MKPSLPLLAGALLVMNNVPGGTDGSTKEPSANEIVQMVLSRTAAEAGRRVLFHGTLSCARNSIPFSVELTRSQARFDFDDPQQSFHLDISGAAGPLTEVSGRSELQVPFARYVSGIRGTDVTFDDLSMRYLCWPEKRKMGVETIKTRKCHVVDLYNPQALGEYFLVRVFVDREKGWLMRTQAYDWNGKLVKSCSVTAGMKVDDAIFLKRMEVVRYVPGSRRVASETIIELKKPFFGSVAGSGRSVLATAGDHGSPALTMWRQFHFGSSENAGSGADVFDFDNDGLTNIVEFAFGLDPVEAGGAGLPQAEFSHGRCVYSFTAPRELSGISYGAEWSATMEPDDWHAIPDTGSGARHTFVVPAADRSRLFLRLVVTAQ